MKKYKNLVFGGIQQKIFNLVLYVIILMMAAYTVVIVHQAGSLGSLVTDTNSRQKAAIAESTRQIMDAVISQSMGQSTQMEAYIANDLFEDLADTVNMLGDYAGNLFHNSENYVAQPYALPDPAQEGTITVQLLSEEGLNLNDPELAEQLGLVANMSDMMKALYANGNVNSCYIALPQGAMLLADDHSAGKYDESGALMPIPIRERAWYMGARETGHLFYTDVVQDVFTGQIGIMCALPVYHGNRLAAVVGADLFLDNMAEAVAGTGGNGSFTFIVNQYGHVVFSPMTEGALRVRDPAEAEDLRASTENGLGAFVESALKGVTGVTSVTVDGADYYMTGAPIEKVGWTVISAVSQELAQQPTVMMETQYDDILSGAQSAFNSGLNQARNTILVLLAVILVLGVTGALLLSKRIVKPLSVMTNRVQSLGGQNLQFFMEDAFRTGDEIEVLAESFATLSARTLQYVDQVQRVTAEKERIGAELNMATDIQASQLPRLFPAFPNRPEFDVYASMTPAKEVGGDFYDFFLIDSDHLALVIADVSDKGVPAALFMMSSKILLNYRARLGGSPAEILSDVNVELCRHNPSSMFVTVWLGILELSTGRLSCSSAGHEYPFLRQNGRFALYKDRHGLMVGARTGVRYRDYEIQLMPGDAVFVYTDGVPEAQNAQGKFFGLERTEETLNAAPQQSAESILDAVKQTTDSFKGDARQFDDLTMLCMIYRGSPR